MLWPTVRMVSVRSAASVDYELSSQQKSTGILLPGGMTYGFYIVRIRV